MITVQTLATQTVRILDINDSGFTFRNIPTVTRVCDSVQTTQGIFRCDKDQMNIIWRHKDNTQGDLVGSTSSRHCLAQAAQPFHVRL